MLSNTTTRKRRDFEKIQSCWTDAAPPVIGEPFVDNNPLPLVMGGQGRTDQEVEDDAMSSTIALAILFGLAAVVFVAWVLWPEGAER